jgi:hypothetical protein
LTHPAPPQANPLNTPVSKAPAQVHQG